MVALVQCNLDVFPWFNLNSNYGEMMANRELEARSSENQDISRYMRSEIYQDIGSEICLN